MALLVDVISLVCQHRDINKEDDALPQYRRFQFVAYEAPQAHSSYALEVGSENSLSWNPTNSDFNKCRCDPYLAERFGHV